MPTILFFAFSGALQTFGLHESERRGEPPPTPWIATLASVHKDQHLPVARAEAPVPEAARPAPAASARAAPVPSEQQKSPLALKVFVLLMAVGLSLSSLIGMYLALSNPRNRKECGFVLGLGALVPVALLLM